MKRFILSLVSLTLLMSISQAQFDKASILELRNAEKTPDAKVEKRIDDLLKKLTIEEKIGQMTMLDYTTYVFGAWVADTIVADTTKLIPIFKDFKVGCFVGGFGVPAKQWYNLAKTLQDFNYRYNKIDVPIIYSVDHMHGAGFLEHGTVFPHNLNMGATFNPSLVKKEGEICGNETAKIGHHIILAPVLDLGCNPLWPRFHEAYSEDPYLCSVLGAEYVTGLQENKNILPRKQAACAKHFVGSDPRTGWDRSPSFIPDQVLWEMHIPAFKSAIDAGMKAILLNSGELNTVPVHASEYVVTELLREELGFKGVVITDWEDVARLSSGHNVVATEKEATLLAIQAGIDISMTPLDTRFCNYTKELIDEGLIPIERIDLSVARILRLKLDLGLFENPMPEMPKADEIFNSKSREVSLNAARESIVLMKNEDVLPLKETKNILLCGLTTNSKMRITGGWTMRWHPKRDSLFPEDMHTMYTAIKKEYPNAIIDSADISNIEEKAKKADVIIVATGEIAYSEMIGNLKDFALAKSERDLIQKAQSTGKPVVLTLYEGRPRIIEDIYDDCKAVIWAGLPGYEGAQAVAEVISGKVNPSGRLPFSYPKYPHHYYPYNHKNTNHASYNSPAGHLKYDTHWEDNLLAFGDGLSYTTFEYSNLTLSDTIISENGTIAAEVTVKNTGKIAGKEAVLWFVKDDYRTITPPVKELQYFEKQELKAGEAKVYKFTIKKEHLEFPDKNGDPLIEAGSYKLIVKNLELTFYYK